MKKVLISLVSDQTIPNVLLIKELAFRNFNFDEYLFLSTDKMEANNTTENIIKSCNIHKNKAKKILIPEANLEGITHILIKENFSKENEYLLNISGGTKIMVLGVYNFFTNNLEKTTVCYLPIGENKISIIYPNNKECPIDYRLNVEEYLLSYGLNSSINETSDSIAIEPEKFLSIYKNNRGLIHSLIFIQNTPKVRNLFNRKKYINLSEILRDDFKMKNNLNFNYDELFNFLKNCGFNPEKIQRKELKYITGGWFEHYIYNTIKQITKLNNDGIAMNIKLKNKNVENEFDVMFTLNNNLHIIECKTGLSGKNGNLVNDTLYKQQALRRDFGLTVQLFLFTLDEISKESDIDRAKLFNIRIIDSKYFENKEILTNKLKEILKVS